MSIMRAKQICLSLQKIILPRDLKFTSLVTVHILSDSGYEHEIQARQVKNNTVNLFGQKIFLPQNTKQILFDLLKTTDSKITERICGFTYEVQSVSIAQKRKTITGSNQFYNQFKLLFSIKLQLQLDNATIHLTDTDLSDIYSPFNPKNKGFTRVGYKGDNELDEVSRVYSPKNAKSNFIAQGWQIKSEHSPSKRKISQNQNNEDASKKQTQEPLTIQSQQVRKRHNSKQTQTAIKLNEIYQNVLLNSQKQQKQSICTTESIFHTIINYKNSIIFGAVVGLFSAIASTQYLIL